MQQTWTVIMGAQLLTFLIAGIMVICWMKRPKDRYDELLEKVNERNDVQVGKE